MQGLNVTYVNIEKVVADGAEGDDRFFIQSTGLEVVTEIDGGLGSDTFFVGGNPSNAPVAVVSNDFRGHSGIVLHSIEAGSYTPRDPGLFSIEAQTDPDQRDAAIAAIREQIRALSDRPVPEDVVAFGEIGLSGELRMVSQADLRLREAGKLGFRRALRPKRRGAESKDRGAGVAVLEIGHLQDLIDWLYGGPAPGPLASTRSPGPLCRYRVRRASRSALLRGAKAVASFRVKANPILGPAAMTFTARRGPSSARIEESIGV